MPRLMATRWWLNRTLLPSTFRCQTTDRLNAASLHIMRHIFRCDRGRAFYTFYSVRLRRLRTSSPCCRLLCHCSDMSWRWFPPIMVQVSYRNRDKICQYTAGIVSVLRNAVDLLVWKNRIEKFKCQVKHRTDLIWDSKNCFKNCAPFYFVLLKFIRIKAIHKR